MGCMGCMGITWVSVRTIQHLLTPCAMRAQAGGQGRLLPDRVHPGECWQAVRLSMRMHGVHDRTWGATLSRPEGSHA
jgi:hypothetical protein